MSKTIKLELSNNQALHLWGMMVAYIHDTRNQLVADKVFKKDGTPNKNRKYYSDANQEKVDNLALSELIYKEIENQADFSELERT